MTTLSSHHYRYNQIQNQMQSASVGIHGNAGTAGDTVGRKLQGRPAATLRIPIMFRYKLALLTEQAAVVRNWEDRCVHSCLLHSDIHIYMHTYTRLTRVKICTHSCAHIHTYIFNITSYNTIQYNIGSSKAPSFLPQQQKTQKRSQLPSPWAHLWTGSGCLHYYSPACSHPAPGHTLRPSSACWVRAYVDYFDFVDYVD